MTAPTTPRRLNADVFRRARKAGAPLHLAAYVAAPPVLDLTWLSHYQFDGEWADFELNGRQFRATMTAPGYGCESCAELVQAWRDEDEGVAWMTSDQYDQTDHRVVTVGLLTEDGDGTNFEASLHGVCSARLTEVDRLADDRYLAEIVAELADESAHDAERAETAARKAAEQARNRRDAERREIIAGLIGVAAAHGARPTDLAPGFRRTLGWIDEEDDEG